MPEKPSYEELEKEVARLRRAERSFREDRSRLHIIANQALDSIFIKDAQRRYTFVNPAMTKLFGCAAEDLLGKRPEDIFELEDAAAVTKVDDLAFEGEDVSEIRKLIINSEPVYFHTIQTPIRDSRGQVIGTCGIVRDITRMKRLEKEIRGERDRAQQYLDLAGVIFVALNSSGEVTLINQKGLEVLEYEEEEVIGKDWFENFLPEDAKERVKSVSKKILAGEIETLAYYENHVLTKSGEARLISWHNVEIKDSEGRITGTLSSGVDLTDFKLAQENLRKEKEFTETALNSQQDTFFLFDPETGKALRWNRAFKEITGYTDEEVAANAAPDTYCTPEGLKQWRILFQEVMKTGTETIELDLVCKNGRKLPTEYVVSVIRDEYGQPEYIISIGRDISRRKQMEAELHHSQKMKAIGTLAAGIAHDFNNILGVILGYAELSLMEAGDGSELRENLSCVIGASSRAKELIKQILAYSSQNKAELKPVKIDSLVKETMLLLEATIPSYIEKQVDMAPGLNLVMADPGQIQQVLVNLCTNAQHAMEEKGGVLKISVREVTIGPYEPGGSLGLSPGPHVCITVQDQGCGMEKESVGRVFEPYFTTKKKGKGTGLGLSVVYGIVKSHNGLVTVESDPGKGSAFHVYLPAVEAYEEVVPQKNPRDLLHGKERLLLVDDEEMLALSCKKRLEALGYRVTVKPDGLEALELFQADPGRFDLLITDQAMPHMTGESLLKEILKIRPEMPVILCTGFSETMDETKAKALGAKAYLLKPLSMEKLAQAVRNALDE